jgi:hypothetical protein
MTLYKNICHAGTLILKDLNEQHQPILLPNCSCCERSSFLGFIPHSMNFHRLLKITEGRTIRLSGDRTSHSPWKCFLAGYWNARRPCTARVEHSCCTRTPEGRRRWRTLFAGPRTRSGPAQRCRSRCLQLSPRRLRLKGGSTRQERR